MEEIYLTVDEMDIRSNVVEGEMNELPAESVRLDYMLEIGSW